MIAIATRLVLLILVSCCAVSAHGAVDPHNEQSVVLILMDGFRWDLITPSGAPNLDRLAKSGTSGEMIPVWPPISCPNHWALVSGLYPAHSGVFHNEMYDPATGKNFELTNENWARGETIWAAVSRQGGISGVVGGWAGSEIRDGKNRPSFQIPYSPKYEKDLVVGPDNRAQIVLDLLDQSLETRPNLVALYVGDLDDAEHQYGVQSAEANGALRKIDDMIGQFVGGLKQRDLARKVNIVIVADHGQLNWSSEQTIYLDDFVDPHQLLVRPVGGGPVFALWPKSGMAGPLYERLQQANPHLHVWRPGELPARWNCCSPERVPPILVTVDTGWSLSVHGEDPFGPGIHGTHGYDNEVREMHALFVANGPAISSGLKITPFSTVDIYSLLAELLNVKPAKTDGSIQSLCSVLVNPPSSCKSAR